MKQTAFLIIVLFLALYFFSLGLRPLVVPDETRYAEIPREILATGDWVVPRLNGVRYFEKPPLGYWLTAVSLSVFGENRFAVRFPAALAAGLSALLVAWFAWRGTQNSKMAVLASAIFLSSAEVFGLGIYNVLDGPFSFFVTATLFCFFFAYRASGFSRVAWLAIAGAASGAAFLTKGFLAFAIPAVAITPFLFWEKRWRDLLTLPWLPAIVTAAIAGPWCWLIHQREPDFWRYFFWVEHIRRFASQEAQHAEPFWYYLPTLAIGLLPWTFIAPAALSGLRHARPWPSELRFAFCSALGPLLLFSFSRGKIATYILPCYAPLAVCLAVGLDRYFERPGRSLFHLGATLSSLMAIIGAIALAWIQTQPVTSVPVPYAPHESWRWMLLVAALGFWASAGLLSLATRNVGEKLALYALSPSLLMFAAHAVMPETFEARKAPSAFLQQFADRVPPEAAVVTDNNLVHAVCWQYKRTDVYLLDSRGELEYGLSYPDAAHRALDINGFNDLIRRHAPEGPVVLIAEKHDLEKYWRGHIPEPGFKAENEKYFIATFRTPLRAGTQTPPRP